MSKSDNSNEENKIKDHWKLHTKAKELFGKNNCFICDRKVSWSSKESEDENQARMLNFTNSKELNEKEWKTICKRCLKRKVLKETLEEGLH